MVQRVKLPWVKRKTLTLYIMVHTSFFKRISNNSLGFEFLHTETHTYTPFCLLFLTKFEWNEMNCGGDGGGINTDGGTPHFIGRFIHHKLIWIGWNGCLFACLFRRIFNFWFLWSFKQKFYMLIPSLMVIFSVYVYSRSHTLCCVVLCCVVYHSIDD